MYKNSGWTHSLLTSLCLPCLVFGSFGDVKAAAAANMSPSGKKCTATLLHLIEIRTLEKSNSGSAAGEAALVFFSFFFLFFHSSSVLEKKMRLLYFAAKTCTNWKRHMRTHAQPDTITHTHTKKGSLSSNRFILHTTETKPWKAKIEKCEKKNQAWGSGATTSFLLMILPVEQQSSWCRLKAVNMWLLSRTQQTDRNKNIFTY